MRAVVVSYNTRALTVRCVRSLLAAGDCVTEIVVVDNGSSDGSADAIEGISEKVWLLRVGKNVGFGAANNLGIGLRLDGEPTDYIALVNSDAFVDPQALSVLGAYGHDHPDVGVFGPQLLNSDGSRQVCYFHFPSPARAWLENSGLQWFVQRLFPRPRSGPRTVDWVSGACFVFRREVWEQVGGFDESFFLYSEETDLQRRIHNAGWKIHWVPEARVEHLGGASGTGSSLSSREYFYSGVDRYFRKHHGRSGVLHLRAAMIFGAFFRCAASGVDWRSRDEGRYKFWRWLLWRQLTCKIPR